MPEYRRISPPPYTHLDAELIHELAKRLLVGEMIASHRSAAAYERFGSEEDVSNRFEQAREQLREVPNKLSHIVSAAMIRKLSFATETKKYSPIAVPVGCQVDLLQKYCKSDAPVRKRLIELEDHIKQLDLLIAQSIEGTEALNFYQRFLNQINSASHENS